MEEGKPKPLLFGDGAAHQGIKNVADNFDLLMANIEKAEKAKNVGATGRLIEEQIRKTAGLVETDNDWAKTRASEQIAQAHKRLLKVLKDMKQAYAEVNQVRAAQKNLENIEEQKRKEQERLEAINLEAIKKTQSAREEAANKYKQLMADVHKSIHQMADETARNHQQAAEQSQRYNLKLIEEENKAIIKANSEKSLSQ